MPPKHLRFHDSAISAAILLLTNVPASAARRQRFVTTGISAADFFAEQLIKDFKHQSKSPAAIYFAISQLPSPTMPLDDLITLVTSASNRFKGHTGLNILKERLTVTAEQNSPKPYPLIGKPAPNLTMQDVNGKPVSISDFKGKYVLVDFWASWCGPCRQENPNVVAAYNKYKGKNFTILGVSLDDDKQAWKQAIAKDGLAWNHMSDLKMWDSEAVKAYNFDGIPLMC